MENKISSLSEIWKEVKGYEGLYQVSSLGRVKSVARLVRGRGLGMKPIVERILKPCVVPSGHLQVVLCRDGKEHKHKSIHRLVAEAFIPNPENKPCIDHIDTNPKNNNVDNLRWVTIKENCNNEITRRKNSIAKKGERNCNFGKRNEQVHNARKVLCFTMDGLFVAEYPSLNEASRRTGIRSSNIGIVCSGRRKCAGGYIWKYKKEYNLLRKNFVL